MTRAANTTTITNQHATVYVERSMCKGFNCVFLAPEEGLHLGQSLKVRETHTEAHVAAL